MANNELQIAGSQGELRIRPYEHHAKYYETDQMGIIHHSNYGHHSSQQLCEMDGRSENGSDGSDGAEL